MSSSRVQRGRQSEAIVAAHLRKHGWPDAERTPASLPGKDILNTGDIAFEVKARRGLDLPGWLRQAVSRKGFPVLVIRPDGSGEKNLEAWAMVIPFGLGVELLRKAGYGSDGEDHGSAGDPGVQGEERELPVSVT